MTTEPALDDLPTFPQQRGCPLGLAPEYSRLRTEEPISRVRMPSGEAVWLITKYEYVRQILGDSRVSADRMAPGFPVLLAFPNREAMRKVGGKSLNSMNPPEHTFHRRILISEFTVKQIRKLRPRIQEIVDACIDNLLQSDKPVDLVSTLSMPLPSQLICDLLGVPYGDREFFEKRTKIMLSRKTAAPEKGQTLQELLGYLHELIARKENEDDGGLICRLINRYREAGSYERHTVLTLVALLLTAGHETTSNMISLGTVALLEYPEQLAAVRRDPTLLPTAVEELLRFFTVSADVTGYRAALEDIEIGGVTIREGEGIIALGSAANRDPEVFTEPDKVDVHRGARHHLAFGFGMHQCLGQNLARVELEIALGTLFRRVPTLRLAVPLEEVSFKDDASVYGVHELPVTW
ncbi:MAG TPA: cytochrome P450 [Nonomuraea sp.]|nr:cytochrome P450 [Nonomuraea sp.]